MKKSLWMQIWTIVESFVTAKENSRKCFHTVKALSDSPCIGLCKTKDGICIGCGRAMVDIQRWQSYSVEQKEKANIEAYIRRKRLDKQQTEE